jgi:hypothetical protein
MSSHAPTRQIPLFDAMYREFGFTTDADIARVTESNHSTISHIRHGRLPITDRFICRAARGTGWSVARIDELVMWGQA